MMLHHWVPQRIKSPAHLNLNPHVAELQEVHAEILIKMSPAMMNRIISILRLQVVFVAYLNLKMYLD